MPPEVSDRLLAGSIVGEVEYIKISHHGSLNGVIENLLKATMPEIAVISVGKNSWNFPRPKILDTLAKYGSKILRIDKVGDVEVIIDGTKYWVKLKMSADSHTVKVHSPSLFINTGNETGELLIVCTTVGATVRTFNYSLPTSAFR